MTKILDAMISYGRADSKAFAEKLEARLKEQGFQIWFDFNDIPLGVDFQNQIDDGIEKASNFLFVISPHSVNSPYCLKEIELAIKLKKRIIPLLHVMQISRETWQQRNPSGTEADWEAYKAQGRHESYKNMHPTIQKLNWVYFQEEQNDFEESLAGLIDLLRSHADYVKQHTRLLVKALEWERNQRQTRYMLVGEERQQAEAWLKVRFKNEQPPCMHTDLHCEFITESIKNGNNLMTQVFLSYADEERGTMQKIRNSLRRESITVWTNTTDIKTGETFVEAINRGIEEADNLVYLLSPDSINSTYCQQELELALSLNKRIIPLLVRKTDPTQVPENLRSLHYIDLTDNVREEDYRLDESELLKILLTDAAYYNEHKILLTKALKWQRQHNNPSILLRGYNLRSAETWLKVERTRAQHPPTQLQEEFIAESLRQPPLESLDVFISFSPADSDFARKLNDALQTQGKMTWFDQESIASETELQEEINRGIKACDNFLFVLSPRSVNSPDCKDEVEYAARLNKRFVTVLHRQVNPSDLHPELAKVQWIDFNRNESDFNANFNELVRTLDTDREHVRSHTKWLQQALEWEQKEKDDDLLLRGSEFVLAEDWLETALAGKKQPVPTGLQQAFIEESHKAIIAAEEAEKKRQAELLRLQEEKTKEAEARLAEQKRNARLQKFFLAVTSVGFVVATGLGVIAWRSSIQAKERKKEAEAASVEAKAASAEAKAKSSEASYASDRKLDALVEAIEAKKTLQDIEASKGQEASKSQEATEDVDAALQQAAFGVREHNRLSGHDAGALAVALSPDGKTIASGGLDNRVILWNSDGERKTTIEHRGSVNDVAFSPDGQSLASASADNTVKLWNPDGTLLATMEGHEGDVRAVAFDPEGKLIASASADNTVKLWNPDGSNIATLEGHSDEVNAVAFSPDGESIASASDDQTVKLWDRDGNLLDTLSGDSGHNEEVEAVAFSPDGKLIASAGDDKTVKLWNPDGTLFKTLTGHSDLVNDVAFNPDGKSIASASNDKTIKLWDLDGTLRSTFSGHGDRVKSVFFSPDRDNPAIASASLDNTVRLWKLQIPLKKSLLKILYEHQDAVTAVSVSPDGQSIATASDDKTVKLWQREDNELQATLSLTGKVRDVAFSPDGQLVATASRDKKVDLWRPDGTKLKTIAEGNKVNRVVFSPDASIIATASDDNTIQLWRRDGTLLATLEGHEESVKGLDFSPDGQLIVSGSSDNTIRFWNLSGKLLSSLTAHKGPVNYVSFSPDGKTIASGSDDNTIKLWNRDGIKIEIADILKGHDESVNEVVFSADGQKIASASADGTVKLWKRDGTELSTLYEHTGAVNGVAFSPTDNNLLLSVGSDQQVVVWNIEQVLEQENLAEKGCNWLRDYLRNNEDLEEEERNLCKEGY
ncbi:MAG: TIR domain-containing protein [Oscillatoria sp. SIO1A7]|nr:TIR domain-containing protein [Oscillatoria sp. SIO1A7]